MSKILLTTLNARYSHASFALRYLAANLNELRPDASIVEFELTRAPADIAARLLDESPAIIGFGVYIWNVRRTTEVVLILKRLRPSITIVLGGPEVSYEIEDQEIARHADYVVQGEADLTFPALLREILAGRAPAQRIIVSPVPALKDLRLPYDEYTDEDIAHRIVYVEASRGCPFECEFCLSALDIPVRTFDLDRFLGAMQRLLDRGARLFKFVDRTFNLNLPFAERILGFFLERMRPGLFLHFEMIPDRLPHGLRRLIAAFPPGALQFEVGVQTLDDEVAARISRRQDLQKLESNLRFLQEETGVHVHADLVLGLPGETLDRIAAGFDRLFAMGAQEIQVGILKRLRGTPIVRHTDAFRMVYSPFPPYEILENSTLSFDVLLRLGRFAQIWDHLQNSGNFKETAPLVWSNGRSPFAETLAFADFVQKEHGQTHAIALAKLLEYLFRFLVEHRTDRLDPHAVAEALWRDWRRGGRSDRPPVLRPYISDEEARAVRGVAQKGLERQARHRRED